MIKSLKFLSKLLYNTFISSTMDKMGRPIFVNQGIKGSLKVLFGV